ncbi:MAG: phosphomannomutase/phosphoglucomutase [Gammaproteobacteria bacterium]
MNKRAGGFTPRCQFRWPMLLRVALGAVIGAALAFSSKGEAEQVTDPSTKISATADALAAEVGSRFRQQIKLLDALSRDEALIAAFKNPDSGALDQRARQTQLPYALKVRFVRAGQIQVDERGTPPLGYASVAMLRHAERTQLAPNAEVHFLGSAQQQVALVKPVSDAGGVFLGSIHASLDIGVLDALVKPLRLDGAYIELRQVGPAASPVLAKLGSAEIAAGTAAQSQVPVAGTQWVLAYWPPTDARVWNTDAPVTGNLLLFLGAGVVVFGTIGAVVFAKKRGRPPVSEAPPVYQGALRAIIDGEHPYVEHLVPDLSLPARARKPSSTMPKDPLDDTLPLAIDYAGAPAPVETAQARTPLSAEPSTPASDDPAEDTLPLSALDLGSAVPLPSVDFDLDPAPIEPSGALSDHSVPDSIFRAYDIRGIVAETLTEEAVYKIGLALGSEASDLGQAEVVVARDGRVSSPVLAATLQRGLRDSGRNVIDIGMVPTPVLYFATHYLNTQSGIMLTGSHNPPNYNGLKIVMGGQALSGEAITSIRDRIRRQAFTLGAGTVVTQDVVPAYVQQVTDSIGVSLSNGLKLVVDCGNGVPGMLAPRLMTALGHDVIELYCEVDGSFPNHHPDPAQPDNLRDLIAAVKAERADLGLAFDGDGDRLGVVDGEGNIIWPDRQMMLFARDVLARNPGKEIIFDVKCSRHLRRIIEEHGGKPVMWKTGHSLIKAKMRVSDAPLAGEMSGHIFFKERWYGFDDALYAAARLLEILVQDGRPPAQVFAELPGGLATPELKIDMPESDHARFMARLCGGAVFEGAEITLVDGLRVDWPDAWGLIRPSNTTPCLVLRFEGDNPAALERVQTEFRHRIHALDPGLQLPF